MNTSSTASTPRPTPRPTLDRQFRVVISLLKLLATLTDGETPWAIRKMPPGTLQMEGRSSMTLTLDAIVAILSRGHDVVAAAADLLEGSEKLLILANSDGAEGLTVSEIDLRTTLASGDSPEDMTQLEKNIIRVTASRVTITPNPRDEDIRRHKDRMTSDSVLQIHGKSNWSDILEKCLGDVDSNHPVLDMK
jgi:hypothetical protein